MDFVKIDFEKGEGLNTYRDSLTLTQEQYAAMSEQDIEEMKEQRYQAWLAFLNTPQDDLPQE